MILLRKGETMAELNLKQITDKLNSEFAGNVRKLIFWYDADAEFVDDVATLELDNAKVLHLEKDNQFFVKHFLECVDTTTNYLVYAPFAKPDVRENHLADTIHYSKEFLADRASLIMQDLGINGRLKPVIKRYIKFFGSKERTQKFYDLEIDNYTESLIEIALMSVLCKNKMPSFEEVLRCILTDDGFVDNKYLAEFKKYDLIDAFWKHAEVAFGYSDNNPTLEKLIITMFITYANRDLGGEIPQPWKSFVSYKQGSIVTFTDNLMNSYLYGERFEEISQKVFGALDAKKHFEKMNIENLIECCLFRGIDELIIAWMVARLENEDVGAKLNGKTIPQLCAERRKKHFGKYFRSEYFIIENAYYIILNGAYQYISGIKNLIREYTQSVFKIDRRYRYFYYYLDSVEDSTAFEQLRDLVENIYTNEFLNKITANWNQEFSSANGKTDLVLQRNFFTKYLSSSVERTVVIISDAFRYEVAQSLLDKLNADEKCIASITAMQGVLPSYTPLGMAALLPHKTLEYSNNYDVLVDGKVCTTTEHKEKLLKSYKPNSKCVQFDSLKNMKQADLRTIFTGQEVVYVYHNQIDARGDAANSENEVFTACEEAIEEIYSLMRRLSSMANTHHFFVTADHGFIYKRDKITATDKIVGASAKSNSIGQRYAISDEVIEVDGVCSTSLSEVLGNDDNRVVSYPLASDIFKVAGAGQNFVHGGCSPQEMLVPLVEVKIERGKKETSSAKIALVSLTSKITNLITTLDFVQIEPVSDIVKEAVYRIYFISENNEKISNENICIADKKDSDTMKRMFRFHFNFKDKRYDKSQKYYLVAYDDKNNIEILRHEIIMDVAFAGGFGFFG